MLIVNDNQFYYNAITYRSPAWEIEPRETINDLGEASNESPITADGREVQVITDYINHLKEKIQNKEKNNSFYEDVGGMGLIISQSVVVYASIALMIAGLPAVIGLSIPFIFIVVAVIFCEVFKFKMESSIKRDEEYLKSCQDSRFEEFLETKKITNLTDKTIEDVHLQFRNYLLDNDSRR